MGANWRSVIPALAKAAVLHREGPKAPKARLDQAAAAATAAFHVCPNLQLLVDVMLAHPPEEWQQRCPLTPGTCFVCVLNNGAAGPASSTAPTWLHCPPVLQLAPLLTHLIAPPLQPTHPPTQTSLVSLPSSPLSSVGRGAHQAHARQNLRGLRRCRQAAQGRSLHCRAQVRRHEGPDPPGARRAGEQWLKQPQPTAAAMVACASLLYNACNPVARSLPLPLPAQRAALAAERCRACAAPDMSAMPAWPCRCTSSAATARTGQRPTQMSRSRCWRRRRVRAAAVLLRCGFLLAGRAIC